jgi:hypothetical protein
MGLKSKVGLVAAKSIGVPVLLRYESTSISKAVA